MTGLTIVSPPTQLGTFSSSQTLTSMPRRVCCHAVNGTLIVNLDVCTVHLPGCAVAVLECSTPESAMTWAVQLICAGDELAG